MSRRAALAGGGGVAAAAALSAVSASSAVAATGGSTTTAYTAVAKNTFERTQITRRALNRDDVEIDILYVGLCHTDVHRINDDFGANPYPFVPGHEIVGRVSKVGRAVRRFKVGELVGVGYFVDSCGVCDSCRAGLDHLCLNGTTSTDGTTPQGQKTYGGFSKKIVVREGYVLRIPKGLDPKAAAPLLCAGITTYSPLRHWGVGKGTDVGVVGIGGLGHLAVRQAVSLGARVTAFTTTPAKTRDILRLGASEVVTWPDAAAFTARVSTFDHILICTPNVAVPLDVQPFLSLVRPQGVVVNVGVLGAFTAIAAFRLVAGNRVLAGSQIGSIGETQTMLNRNARLGIESRIEMISVDEISTAVPRIVGKDVKFRFVVDMSTL